jgi:hypothetical protein
MEAARHWVGGDRGKLTEARSNAQPSVHILRYKSRHLRNVLWV